VLEGGRAPRRLAAQATFRRRRVGVALVSLAMVVALILLAITAMARIAGGIPSPAAGELSPTPVAAIGTPGVAARTVVVQPGDTLWSIAATATAPSDDVRATVDQIVARNGGDLIVVGQEVELPVP
jgi:LysM repeat protein